MLDSESLDSVLENEIVRSVAGVGLLLVIEALFEKALFTLGSLVQTSLIFETVWRLTIVTAIASLATAGGWAALSILRKYEQPWWLVVLGAFMAWIFLVAPVATYLPNFLTNLILLAALAVQAVGVVLAAAMLDRAVPKLSGTSGFGIGNLGRTSAGHQGHQPVAHDQWGQQHEADEHPTQQHIAQQPWAQQPEAHQPGTYQPESGQREAYQPESEQPTVLHEAAEPEAARTAEATTPAGWYPDPRGEAASRWWDGEAWTTNLR